VSSCRFKCIKAAPPLRGFARQRKAFIAEGHSNSNGKGQPGATRPANMQGSEPSFPKGEVWSQARTRQGRFAPLARSASPNLDRTRPCSIASSHSGTMGKETTEKPESRKHHPYPIPPLPQEESMDLKTIMDQARSRRPRLAHPKIRKPDLRRQEWEEGEAFYAWLTEKIEHERKGQTAPVPKPETWDETSQLLLAMHSEKDEETRMNTGDEEGV
jgi:hypothetical protein